MQIKWKQQQQQLGNTMSWNNRFFCSIYCQPDLQKSICALYIHSVSLVSWPLSLTYVVYLRNQCCAMPQSLRHLFQAHSKTFPSVPMAEYRPYVGLGSHLAITPTSICKWGFVLHSMAFQGWALICCPLCSPCIISIKVKVRRWQKIKPNIGSYPKQSAEWITAWLQPGGVYVRVCTFCLHGGLGSHFIHLVL